jgi:cell division protein DivIC
MTKQVSNRSKWVRVLKNKYFISSLLFLAWIIFFDENSFVSHAENNRRLNELNRQKEYYQERIETDKQKLEDLNAGINELEKFAREQFFMSKPDEDIFIVVEQD